MSVLTGKCDFYDSVEMIGNIEEYLGDNADIYVGDIKIPNNTKKDLIPYYPFIVSMGGYSKEHRTVYLQKYSYIDYEEYGRLEGMLNDVKKYYRKCKREKRDFVFDEMMKKIWTYSADYKDIYKELFDRVQADYKKASIFGLSLPFFNKYSRESFYNLLIENGYDEWFAHKWVYNRKEQLWYERHYYDYK